VGVRLAVLVVSTALATALAACGDSPDGATSATTRADPATSLAVTTSNPYYPLLLAGLRPMVAYGAMVDWCAVKPRTSCIGSDIHGAMLRGALLDDADLSGADLSGADLASSSFTAATLTGADLSGAVLTGAGLNDVVGSGMSLAGATLELAAIDDSDLHDADLHGLDANFGAILGTNLAGANLLGANLPVTAVTTPWPLASAGPHEVHGHVPASGVTTTTTSTSVLLSS